jgi:hypothetical protein
MTQACAETGQAIEPGQIFRAATQPGLRHVAILGQEALEQIPEIAQQADPCQPDDGGIDIHLANYSGGYTTSCIRTRPQLTRGAFLFSVSQESAAKYLPKLASAFQRIRQEGDAKRLRL